MLVGTLIATLLVGAAGSPPGELVKHEKAGVVFRAPKAAEVTLQELPEGPRVIAVTLAEEILLLTVYPPPNAPARLKALDTHVEELERRLRKTGPVKRTNIKQAMLGRLRTARQLTYHDKGKRIVARLVAVRRRGQTLVASWSVPRAELVRAFSPGLLTAIEMPRNKQGKNKTTPKRKR